MKNVPEKVAIAISEDYALRVWFRENKDALSTKARKEGLHHLKHSPFHSILVNQKTPVQSYRKLACQWIEAELQSKGKIRKHAVGEPEYLSLAPFSKKEVKKILVKQRFIAVKPWLLPGEYKVCPNRSDLQIFQRKFWIQRTIRQGLALIWKYQYPKECIADLRYYRNTVLNELRNGKVHKRTKLQCKLLSSIYYCLRQVRSHPWCGSKAVNTASALGVFFGNTALFSP